MLSSSCSGKQFHLMIGKYNPLTYLILMIYLGSWANEYVYPDSNLKECDGQVSSNFIYIFHESK